MISFVNKYRLYCLLSLSCSPLITSLDSEEICGGDKECLLNFYKDLQLPRRDPVKNGHVTKFMSEHGEIYDVKTLSLKPPIFEIKNFLHPEECDEIIKYAEEKGLETSSTMDQGLFEDEKYFVDENNFIFELYDINKDDVLDVDEITRLLDTELDFIPDREDLLVMFKEANFDRDGNNLITKKEFQQNDIRTFMRFIAQNKQQKPYTKSRNSNQTWLETDKNSAQVFHSLRRRLQILTGLPMMLINASESLQVVSYEPRGHYNCHMDSDDVDVEVPCCHLDEFKSNDCRICRYLTVLYFLNDVEKGGETAFPVADNATFDEDVWQNDLNGVCNVGRNCHLSNLRVKPEKGKAILWYSHVIDENTGWLGESDHYSFHGGCDVIKGTKWIANNWISVSENRTEDIELWVEKRKQMTHNLIKNQDDSIKTNDEDDDIFDAVNTGVKKENDDSMFDSVSESSDEEHDTKIDLNKKQRDEL